MKQLKSQIAETVFMPDYLRDWNERGEVKELAQMIYFDILNLYYIGVDSEFLDNRKIRRTCRRIDDLSSNLSQISSPQINLQNWLSIGETVESWIDMAIACEEYEVATNLRKLLNSEYV